AGMRNRLYRLAGAMSREMGAIEQNYAAWIDRYDRVDGDTRRAIMARIAQMPRHPLISVLMPVYNPVPQYLQAAIHSVQDQFYPWWELCIADDASTDPAVVQVLQDAQAGDHRIRLVRREQNGHISIASNSALRLATGSFVALLDHDDILPPHALYEVAARILAQPDVDLLYSDEDHVGADGRRHHPYFKPDWDPELALGQNLVSHFGVYRRSLLERIGGFRPGFEGSQDHDLALRVAAETSPDRIGHIPKVLYHWRQGASERTFSEAAHNRCVLNARRAIQERIGDGALATPAPHLPVWTRVVRPLPSPEPLVSVIIDASEAAALLPRCLDGLARLTSYRALDVIVTGEAPGAVPAGYPVRTCASDSLNAAAAMAEGSLLLLLNAALVPADPDWLREMASQAIRPEVGAVGAKLLARNGLVAHAGLVLGGRDIANFPFLGRRASESGYFGHLQLLRSVSAVSAACLMVRKQAFQEAGGLHETGLPSPLRDVDFCLKLSQMGCRNLWTPYASLFRSSASAVVARDPAADRRAAALMRQRWGSKLESDPYWNPNLAIGPGEMRLAFPPRDQETEARQAA
ncbi:MAG TPA: glycosyltransferase, partial [Rhodopila sp.]|nr:glycosyltransferase [Rhodopila sp.]